MTGQPAFGHGQPHVAAPHPASLLVPGLGPLESALMLTLWRASRPLKVAEVAERLDYPRPLAYSSVATVLVNLCAKGMAGRSQDYNCWRYSAAGSPHDYLNDLIQHMSTLIAATEVSS
jgi:predicted transcriptional regulator